MNLEESLCYIEENGKFGIKLGLEKIAALLEELGNPQETLKFIHVAGTNGKGSVCHMLSAILTKAGYITGMYTSPALESFNERICLNDTCIDDQTLSEVASRVRRACDILVARGIEHPTGFEIETAMAILYFYEKQADICIMEVGMGGRLDATNVIPAPLVAVIMGIDIDHADYLGDTVGKIAAEKAAIIKAGSTAVVYPQRPEAWESIALAAEAVEAPVIHVAVEDLKPLGQSQWGQRFDYQRAGGIPGLKTFTLKLLGEHQQANCATVLTVIALLLDKGFQIQPTAIEEGLSSMVFPGRFEFLNQEPVILIDGAHNPDGIGSFAKNIQRYFPDRPINLFFGMLADKDIRKSLDLLIPLATTIGTLTPDNERALPGEAMSEFIKSAYGREAKVWDTPEDALASIDWTQKKAVNAFVGSLYMIGKVRTAYRHKKD